MIVADQNIENTRGPKNLRIILTRTDSPTSIIPFLTILARREGYD
jgi:hypothetical protein